jgi:DNA polymerase
MSLDLDDRQRAMLQEMGVRVWLPDAVQIPHVDTALAMERVTSGPAPAPIPARAASPDTDNARPASRTEPARVEAVGEPMALQGLEWSALVETAAACQACGLCAGRKHSTLRLPDQAVQADWLVVGDPPDEDEDRLGQAFAEQPGLLLDNMLKAVGASRSGQGRQGAYLSNVVKCRPPAGRLPQPAELAQCAQYLQREMALVQPKLILAMGRFAAQLLLEEHPQEAALPLGKQRGRVYRYRGVPVVVSYHPKVLLRASADKAKAWADLCLAMDTLEPPHSTAARVAAPRGD